jgi:hypothetical protein
LTKTDFCKRSIGKLDDFLADIDKGKWSLNDLKNDVVWQKARIFAREILASLGEKPTKPDLGWLFFAKQVVLFVTVFSEWHRQP